MMMQKPKTSFVKQTFFLVLFALTGGPIFAGKSSAPNVVFLLSDDQAYTDYSFMGHEFIKTPHLDKLAKESVTFKRGYVPIALCRPSIMSMITGYYPSTHLVCGNDPSRDKYKNLDEAKAKMISNIDRFRVIPKILVEEKGYLAYQCGKWWEGNYKRGGFTQGMTRGFPEQGGRHGDDGLEIGRSGMQPVEDFLDHAQKQDKPFFLWYAPFLPHTPHTPPEKYLDKYKDKVDSIHVARYYAMVEWFDDTCGQVIDSIEKRGLKENTIFVYLTDNGWIQDEANSKFAKGSKQSPNEGGTRTPILYSWAGQWKPQDRVELSTSLDIYPTLLDALGIQAPDNLPGMSLLPALEQGAPIERNEIYGESFAHDVADLDNAEAGLLYRWVICGYDKLLLSYDGFNNKYTEFHLKDHGPQLFDLLNDPNERENLAAKKPELVQALKKKLDAWYKVKTVKEIQ